MLSAPRLLARTLVAAVTVGLCGAAGGDSATAATYVVSPSGSDTASGSAGSPFRTISRAAAAARGGDSVTVRSGHYAETVTLTSRNRGAEFRAAAGETPVIDGDGTRKFGFQNSGANDVTISGFEITGQTGAGIYARGERNVIEDNTIHHVGDADESDSNGIRLSRGHKSRISRNTVHHIGPGFQAIGIWLLETRDAHVSQNTVYLVRKEGIRDWKGLDNTISGNRAFLSWVGLSLNTSTGSSVTGNYVYDTVEGIAVKHQSYRTVLDLWNLGSGRWSRIAGNTVYRSTETSVWLGQSDQPMDYVEVRGNVFAGAGTAFIRDSPSLRGPHVTIDGNSYADQGGRPSWVYKAGWGSDPGLSSWGDVRSRLGWEANGGLRSRSMAAPAGTPDTDLSWTPYAMTPVDSSSKGTYYTRTHLDKTADNNQNSYWMTATNRDEHVVYDFGRKRTFNHLVLAVYSHEDRRNVRGYRFAVSTDGREWNTIKQGTNPDPAGSAYPYELDRPRTGRYLRFTAVDNFCASYAPRLGCGKNFVISDLKAGMLSTSRAGEDTAPAARPSLAMSGPSRLTKKGRLRVGIRCSGMTGRIRAGLTVTATRRSRGRASRRTLARAAVTLGPACRSFDIRLSARLARQVRGGRLSTARLAVRLPGGRTQSLRLRITR